jgi:hypothetical protein
MTIPRATLQLIAAIGVVCPHNGAAVLQLLFLHVQIWAIIPNNPERASNRNGRATTVKLRRSGPYAFEILRGIGHFAVEQAPQRINELLLAHLAEHPA